MTTAPAHAPRVLRFLASLVPPLLCFALFITIVFIVMSGVDGLTGVLVGAFAAGCVVLGLLLAYRTGVDRANLKIIRQSTVEGQANWDDGAVVAVEGVVRVDGEPLISPFTEMPCAAYTYVVSTGRYSSSRARNVRVVIAQGFHMLRSRVDSAGRSLRLFALPGFDDELRRVESGTTWGRHARRLIESLEGKAQAAGEGEIVSRLLEARHVETEEVRRDYRMGTIGDRADGYNIEEEVLPVDRAVCIVGTYDRQRNALTARRSKIGPNLMVYPGSASEVAARLGKDVAMYTRVALVLIAIGVATVAFAVVPLA